MVAGNLVFARNVGRQIVAQMVLDTIVVTGLLNASGGIDNPLLTAYFFGVFTAAILHRKKKRAASRCSPPRHSAPAGERGELRDSAMIATIERHRLEGVIAAAGFGMLVVDARGRGAMPGGGSIIARTFAIDGDVRIEVSDSGPGLEPAVRARLLRFRNVGGVL